MPINDPTGADNEEAPPIADLVHALSSERGDEAQEALKQIGAPAIEPVLRAIPGLWVFGQLCALDLLTDWPAEWVRRVTNPSVEEVVVPLLASDSATVREWSAYALGHVQARGAVLPLREALERAKRAGIDPADSEAVGMRRVLTALGDRHPVIPAIMKQLVRRDARLGDHWPAERITELVDGLAAESQVLLYCQAWHLHRSDFAAIESPSFDVDLQGPWDHVVARAHRAVIQAVDGWRVPPDTFVTLEWIDDSDR